MADTSGAPPSVGNTSDTRQVPARVAARLDGLPVTRWHRRILAVVGLGSFFNFFEVALSSLLIPLLPAAWVVTTTDKSLLISATFAGELLGAVALSGLADRVGRRRMFQINLVAYAVLSVATACAQGPTQLIVLRFLLGIGLGAELALVDTYLTELMPAARRGRMLASAYALGMLAVPAAGVLAAKLPLSMAGISSWRWLMVFAGCGALCVYLLRRNLPESPRWLATHKPTEAMAAVDRIEETAGLPSTGSFPAAPARGLGRQSNEKTARRLKLWGPELRRRTALVCVMETLGPIGFYGFASIAPLVLLHKGYTVVESLSYLAMTAIGYPLGGYVLMHLAERVQRRTLVIVSSVLVAVAGTVFGMGTTVWAIVPAGLLTTLMSVINATVSRAYGAELFPTAVRNTALGRTYSLSRLVAVILPFCTLPALEHLGAGPVYLACGCLIALMSVAVALLGPRTNAVALEDV